MDPVLSAFYFGCVEHYRLLAGHPRAIIDIGEHYERQSYRTRTRIVGPNGVQDLNVRIARDHCKKMPMRSVELSYAETWPEQHLHAIRSAYGKTPWFIHYIDDIEAVLMARHRLLIELDLATMRLGMKWLGLKTEVEVSKEYVGASRSAPPEAGDAGPDAALSHLSYSRSPFDFRAALHPKRPLPPELKGAPPYPQVFADRHGFQPRLSVIDLVMTTGPEAARTIRRP